MKKLYYLNIVFALLFFSLTGFTSKTFIDNSNGGKTIKIVCSPDLSELAQQWAHQYCTKYPDLNVIINEANSTDTSKETTKKDILYFFSEKFCSRSNNDWVMKFVIGKEIVVPIINEKNPFVEQINQVGISPSDMKRIFSYPEDKRWNLIISCDASIPLNLYFTKNESVNSKICDFLEIQSNEIKGIEVSNESELLSAIQNDPNGIGFCMLSNTIGNGENGLIDKIKLLPIDRNNNGKIDYFERIYANLNDFYRGAWIGKYPQALINDFYSLSDGIPKNKLELNFLNWILNDGQQLLIQNGFTELIPSEKQFVLDKLSGNQLYSESPVDNYATQKIVLNILLGLMICGILGGFIFRELRSRKKLIELGLSDQKNVISQNTITMPNGLYFDKTHTWVFMEKSGTVRTGIDDFIQHVIGRCTRVILKNKGEIVHKNEPLISLIQDGKQITLYSPITGTITEINDDLLSIPSILNKDPFTDGWIYMIDPSNWLREIQFLIMAGKYKEWIKNEFSRLKDFVTDTIRDQSLAFAFVQQEGGEIFDNVLQDLNPEVWEDFQKKFIDKSKFC
jgi:glycine cleavage system H lipoate-binding protein/ABC-type phosphate transport system substrate-binding protein